MKGFTCYDLKAMLKQIGYTQNNKLKWISQHIPFCVGICSNIPGYEKPFVYINNDMDMLVDNMIAFLNEMLIKSKIMCQWGISLKKLNCKEAEWKDVMGQCREELINWDLNSDHNSHGNVENDMSHITGTLSLISIFRDCRPQGCAVVTMTLCL